MENPNYRSNINEHPLLHIDLAKKIFELLLYLHNPFAEPYDKPSLIRYGRHLLCIIPHEPTINGNTLEW